MDHQIERELIDALGELDEQIVVLRQRADKIRTRVEGQESSQRNPRARAWAEMIMKRHRGGPSPLELVMAMAVLEAKGSLPRAAKMLLERYRSAMFQSKDLTHLLAEFFFADETDVRKAKEKAKTRTRRFKLSMLEIQDSFVLDSQQAMERYQSHHQARLWPPKGPEEGPRLVVVDVLARDGKTVLAELSSIVKRIARPRTRGSDGPECTIARVVRQRRDRGVDEKLNELVNDKKLRGELDARHLAVWIRCPANAPEHIPPGIVHGNWISSIPYSTDEHECREIQLALWRGDTIEGARAHHLYFGVDGGEGSAPDVYNHFALEAVNTSEAILATQRQLAQIHANYWRAMVPRREPGVFEV